MGEPSYKKELKKQVRLLLDGLTDDPLKALKAIQTYTSDKQQELELKCVKEATPQAKTELENFKSFKRNIDKAFITPGITAYNNVNKAKELLESGAPTQADRDKLEKLQQGIDGTVRKITNEIRNHNTGFFFAKLGENLQTEQLDVMNQAIGLRPVLPKKDPHIALSVKANKGRQPGLAATAAQRKVLRDRGNRAKLKRTERTHNLKRK